MSRSSIPLLLAGLTAALLGASASAQIFRLPTLPALPGAPGSAVTTSLTDSFAVADWVGAAVQGQTPRAGTSFDLTPGYHRFTLQSYCLHAGTYGPARGEGYPLAPLKGEKAALIRAILQRSVNHPQIEQAAIQQLIWGIEAGVKFTDFQPSFQAKVAPLLTPADIAGMTITVGSVLNLFAPPEVKNALAMYDNLRRQVTSAQATFADLERLAVLTGAAPLGPGSRDLPAGVWTPAGDGFYARALPNSYSETVLEVYRVAPYQLQRDARGRIIRLQTGGYVVETTYDDAPGRDVLTEGGVTVPIWRFASIRFTGPQPGQSYTITGKGFVLPRNAPAALAPAVSLALAAQARTPQVQFAALRQGGEISLSQYRARAEGLQNARGRLESIQQYRDMANRAAQPLNQGAIDDITDLDHYQDGLEAASEGEAPEWIAEHLQRVTNAWNYASCVLSGDCPPPGDQPAAETASFDPSGFVATPGNTARQRLGLSKRAR